MPTADGSLSLEAWPLHDNHREQEVTHPAEWREIHLDRTHSYMKGQGEDVCTAAHVHLSSSFFKLYLLLVNKDMNASADGNCSLSPRHGKV